jgi:hypothetical protein
VSQLNIWFMNTDIADRLYDAAQPAATLDLPPPSVSAVRRAEATERALHPPHLQYGPVLRDLALATNPTGSAAGLAQQAREFAQVAADMGMASADLSRLAALARSTTERPPSEAEIAAQRRASVTRLRELHPNDRDFDRAVRDAKAIAQRDHRFAAYLDKTNLADHPEVVVRMAELGRRQRSRGAL